MATVFAQLEVAGERHGVHAILVPIRDEAGSAAPGVRIGDSGHTMGLNGVDNGRLWFSNARVPAESLLDRFARISPEGRYESAIANPGRRFFTMLGTLVGGRVSVANAGVSSAKVGLAIAVRYALARRQFGPAGGREVALLDYPSHRRRLLPPLATSYVLSFACAALRRRYAQTSAGVAAGDAEPPDTRELEAQAAALKVLATTHATSIVALRSCCAVQS